MSTLNDLYDGIYAIARKVTQKGGTISSNNASPSLDDIKDGIDSMPRVNVSLTGSASIIVAEVANTTITMEDEYGTVIDTKTTDSSLGGIVTFVTSTFGNYRFTAYDSNNVQLWTKIFGVPTAGVFNCKVGKAFADYTEAEVNTAAKNHYAQYMWSVGDSRNITTVGSSKKWVIGAFEHDDKADGSGKAGITMIMQSYTGSSYKHYNSNVNNIGWEGSLIRQNGLASGDKYYMRATVDNSTSGTYYIYDTTTDTWVAKTLPADYDANEVYYTQNTVASDGAFITGLSAWASYIVPVLKATADAGTAYKKIIKSVDRVFSLSDSEVFGNNNRYSRYSRYEDEGDQYDYFKNNVTDGKLALGYYCWLRSPNSGIATSFCCVYSNGYVNSYSASYGSYARLAFCL